MIYFCWSVSCVSPKDEINIKSTLLFVTKSNLEKEKHSIICLTVSK